MKGGIALPRDFSKQFKAGAELIKKHKFARVISHHDADGIAAGSIMISCLRNAGIGLQATITKSLEREMIERIAREDNELVIFLDMGSGQIEDIEEMGTEVIILDHHKPIRQSERAHLLNPHLFGLDGMHDVSASGLAFILSTTVDEGNWAIAPVAITGLIGDMQHLGGYSPTNESIIDGSASRGLISRSSGLKLSGDVLLEMIADYPNPYFRGLSGRREAVSELLKSAGLAQDAKYQSMDDASKRKLISLLTLRLLSQGCNAETIDQLVGEQLIVSSGSLKGIKIDDLVELVNACGRMDHSGTGIALCLGDPGGFQEAMKFRADYDNSILLEIRAVEDGAFESRASIQIIHPHRSSLAGAVCGISMQYLLDQDKPTIAISKMEGSVKASSRGTRSLIEKGLDLAETMRAAAEPLGGVGGGHAVAAGATVPLVREDEFLKNVDEITARQLGRKK